jgi:AmmeMemoRadiSam system protein B
MGQPSLEYIGDLAQALRTVVGPVLDETLIVVSCNLSSAEDKTEARLLAEETLRVFSRKDATALSTAILEGRINACGGALVTSLFMSGLLDNMRPYFSVGNMACAVDTENNTVYYGAISFE